MRPSNSSPLSRKPRALFLWREWKAASQYFLWKDPTVSLKFPPLLLWGCKERVLPIFRWKEWTTVLTILFGQTPFRSQESPPHCSSRRSPGKLCPFSMEGILCGRKGSPPTTSWGSSPLSLLRKERRVLPLFLWNEARRMPPNYFWKEVRRVCILGRSQG